MYILSKGNKTYYIFFWNNFVLIEAHQIFMIYIKNHFSYEFIQVLDSYEKPLFIWIRKANYYERLNKKIEIISLN